MLIFKPSSPNLSFALSPANNTVAPPGGALLELEGVPECLARRWWYCLGKLWNSERAGPSRETWVAGGQASRFGAPRMQEDRQGSGMY